jgi:homoserine dehydrogenase
MSNSLKIGIAGLGTVGSSLGQLLETKAEQLTKSCGRNIIVTAVSAQSKTKDRGFDLSNIQWFDNAVDLAQNADIDVLVELIGGEDGIAYDAVKSALLRDCHVVTANKALLAKHGMEFAKIAEEKGVILNYEAAIAGGIPIVKAMREALSGNEISRVYGIMNGTCNYILTRMLAENMTFEDCLEDAKKLGYAEADPTFDIEGNDTAHKLALLCSLAFGTELAADEIYLEGITNITIEDIHAADELGFRIKLLGVAQKTETGIEQRVHPTMVPTHSLVAQVDSVTNAVAVETDLLGELVMSGPGAGGFATASAVIGDLADIAKSREGIQHAPVFGNPVNELKPYKRAEMRKHEGGYFIRLSVEDKAGVIANIATHMANNNISLKSIVQRADKSAPKSGNQTVILVTHATMEQSVRNTIEAIEGEGYLIAKAQVIRIEGNDGVEAS